jgi:hypothetical protein
MEKFKMNIKSAKNLVKISVMLGLVALGSVSLNAAAAVITFATGGAGYGGEVISSSTGVTGSNINIGALTLAGTTADGTYTVDSGVMSFDTAASTISIEGSIAALGLSNQTLLTGTTGDYSYNFNNASSLNFFSTSGSSDLSTNFLGAVGLDVSTDFDYFGFAIDSDQVGGVVNAGVVTTSTPSAVPLPAAAWLFISAIAGLTGAKRMSRSKATA